jgi:hypothetical protein
LKISELVWKLNSLHEQYGDIIVTAYPYDGQMNSSEISDIYVSNQRATKYVGTPSSNPWEYEQVESYIILDVYECSCGLSINRDLNASYNILRLGLQSLGENS